MREPRVAVIVLNWNNLDDTLECLASITASRYAAMSVILIDNHSIEDPFETVSVRFPSVRIARQSRNLGYSGGNNVGITWALDAEADYVLLVNNDAIVAKDMIERLVEVGERHLDAGFVTPKILVHGSDRVYWDGGTIDWSRGDPIHDSSSLAPVRDRIRESAWSNGCAVLIRAKTIRQIGLMDDQFFLYYEDVDWSIRASRVGWRHLVALDAICWHKVSRSFGGRPGAATPRASYYYFRNRYRVLAKHASDRASLGGVLRYAQRLLADYHWYRRHVGMRRAVVAAALDLIQRRWGERQERNAIVLIVCDSITYVVATVVFSIWRLVRPLNGRADSLPSPPA